MITAIIIIFHYNQLEGAISDLYKVFQWFFLLNFNIIIISDIEFTTQIIDYLYLYYNKNDIDTFLKNIKLAHFILLKNNKILIDTLASFTYINTKHLFVYYSGHAKNNEIVLPDKTMLSFITFKYLLLNINNDIFCMLDCCYPSCLQLPFKFNFTHNTFFLNENIDCIPHHFLLITSSNNNEKSISSIKGSLFTASFFSSLLSHTSEKKINLIHIIKEVTMKMNKLNVNYKQTISLYSSFNIYPLLPSWLLQNYKFNIYYDLTSDTFLILKEQ